MSSAYLIPPAFPTRAKFSENEEKRAAGFGEHPRWNGLGCKGKAAARGFQRGPEHSPGVAAKPARQCATAPFMRGAACFLAEQLGSEVGPAPRDDSRRRLAAPEQARWRRAAAPPAVAPVAFAGTPGMAMTLNGMATALGGAGSTLASDDGLPSPSPSSPPPAHAVGFPAGHTSYLTGRALDSHHTLLARAPAAGCPPPGPSVNWADGGASASVSAYGSALSTATVAAASPAARRPATADLAGLGARPVSRSLDQSRSSQRYALSHKPAGGAADQKRALEGSGRLHSLHNLSGMW